MPQFLNARPNLLVASIERSVAWYKDVLGFEAVAIMGEPPSFALLMRDGAEIALVQIDEPQPSGCYIYVTEVDALHDDVVAKGFVVAVPLETHPWNTRDFVIHDPDGHIVAVGERVSV